MSESIGVRVQGFEIADQILVVAQLAQARNDARVFAPREIEVLFDEIGLPDPGRMSDLLRGVARRGLVRSGRARGEWRLTPQGAQRAQELVSAMDLTALAAEFTGTPGPLLGQAAHPLVPSTLAPPSLLPGLRRFLEMHAFDRNVFGMTRFPEASAGDDDPLGLALSRSHTACAAHGLTFHLASDRAIDDDLWSNVAGHMWGCRYGIAFFEDRVDRGLSYNLSIEVGAMLMTGRRCALLKDSTIDSMPTDLVGRIYKSVDLGDPGSVDEAIHSWIRDDLGLGECASCAE